MTPKLTKLAQIGGRGPVKYRIDGPADNPSAVSIAVSYSEAPVPEHYYVADYFEVVPLDLEVVLAFGKLDGPKGDRLRNKVEIYFPALTFVQQLWKSSREFHVKLREFVQQQHSSPLVPPSITAPVEKVQTLHSNNVLMVLSAGECLMDFFYISPKELWMRPRRGEDIQIEALVRVICSPRLVLGLLDACEPVADEITNRLGLNDDSGSEVQHADVESQ